MIAGKKETVIIKSVPEELLSSPSEGVKDLRSFGGDEETRRRVRSEVRR